MPDVEVLFSAERIAARVRELAHEIADALGRPDDLCVLVVLKGAFLFGADLLRALDAEGLSPALDFLRLQSYGDGTETSGQVRILLEPSIELRGRPVLLVDDILDTGLSLEAALACVRAREPACVRSVVLLDKPSRRTVSVRADHVGFEVPNRFVVGYGVDHAERWRHLPYVGAVD